MTLEEWIKTQDPAVIRDAFSAAAGWKAAQAAERERIKEIVAVVWYTMGSTIYGAAA